MREAGLTPEEALLAATAGGAELCGLGHERGRIAPGYVFDAIVLDADPGDLSVFRNPGAVTGVFQAGRAVIPHERLPAEAQ
jgi:imidazolonepropionase-like amidohydrolase